MRKLIVFALGFWAAGAGVSGAATRMGSAGTGPAAPAISFGPAFHQGVERALAGYFPSLHGEALASLQSLREAVRVTRGAEKASLAMVLGAIADKPEALKARLTETDLPKASVERLLKIAEHYSSFAETKKEVADELAGARLDAETARKELSAPEAGQHGAEAKERARRVNRFFGGEESTTVVEPPPQKPLPIEEEREPRGAPMILIPTRPELVAYGGVKVPRVAFPFEGTDAQELWLKVHKESRGMNMASYNFDLMPMAEAIVKASQEGKPQVLVGDYSNWFPHKLSQAEHGGQHQERTEAMKLIIANLGDTLKLFILKGLGSIGINHNKFTDFLGLNPFLQMGSANYTGTSMPVPTSHWESIAFSDDPARAALFGRYFDWIMGLARPFSEQLEPEDPAFDPARPIPIDPHPSLVYGSASLPLVSFSPNGGSEDRIVAAMKQVKERLDILMFSPFPTPPMIAVIERLLAAGVPVRFAADRGQGHLPAALKHLMPLIEKGMEYRTISGPNATLAPRNVVNPRSEKMHMKVMLFDGKLLKGHDSTNISKNAFEHNFENNQFWTGVDAVIMQEVFEALWKLASPLDRASIAKMIAAEAEHGAQGRSHPWLGIPK